MHSQSLAVPFLAIISLASAARVVLDNAGEAEVEARHSSYERFVGKNCFINQGGSPVDPEGDPPLQNPVSAGECMTMCDVTPGCVAINIENHGAEGLCFLRKAVDIDRCQDNKDYNVYVHKEDWVDPGLGDHDDICGDLSKQANLLCARHVDWAFLHGKHQIWAPLAYLDMQEVSGVSPMDATLEDFQRLSYCANFRNSRGLVIDREDPCEVPPCGCSNPHPRHGCKYCSVSHHHPIRTDPPQVPDPVASPCPTAPDNGGCCDACRTNRFCPQTRGCFADDEAHFCPGELCAAPADAKDPVVPPGDDHGKYGFHPSSDVFGHWGWCRGNKPVDGWSLQGGGSCHQGPAIDVKVLTYNLFWWNLFGIRRGNWNSAGNLIRQSGPYDIMGFQECDDINRIVGDTGLGHEYGRFAGFHAVSNAWHQTEWELLAEGVEDVAEDHRAQWYGRRGLVWVRLKHYASGAIVFFANHHGPLPVGYPGGGFCGPEATAFNILKVIGENAHKGDTIILTGDFNAIRGSRTHETLKQYLNHQYAGASFDGVDNFYTNDCATKLSAKNLGNGGSDHDALQMTVRIGR